MALRRMSLRLNNTGLEASKEPIVTIEVLNDLTSQFVTISSKVFEIEAELDEFRKVLLDLIEKFS